jgi:purine-binding chemotaxis protein CheW
LGDVGVFLIFSLHHARYGVEAHVAREILELPELRPIAEAPDDIVGVFNCRGKIVPVVDLDMRLGRRPQRYRLTDKVIVLAQEGIADQPAAPLLGIIVNEVLDVWSISSKEIEAAPVYGREGEISSRFVTRVAKVEEEIILLLDHALLGRSSAFAPGLSGDEGGAESLFCPEATPEEREILRERARNLMRPTDSQDVSGLIPLAIVGLSGEYFGVDLEVVREFADIQNIAPIPCCPEHILGNMNLRGDIVTLVDIRRPLRMPIVSAHTAAKAMVVHIDNLLVGVPVDEVFDVIYFHPSDITTVPAAVQSESKAYLKGTAPYGGKMLSLLDLPKILTSEDLIVNEDV